MFEVTLPSRVTGAIGFDNTGNSFTSPWRDSMAVKFGDLTGHGDALSVKGQFLTPNQQDIKLGYQLPLSGRSRWSVSHQATRYQLCCSFAALNAQGSSATTAVDITTAWVRSREFNFVTNVEIQHRRLANQLAGISVNDRSVDHLALGARFDWASDEALSSAYGTLIVGRADLGNVGSDLVADQATANIHGEYKKLSFGLGHSRSVGQGSYVVVSISGQLANNNLDSSESFVLGGMDGVRAYPAGEAAGDVGLIARMEYHRKLGDNFRGFVFYDHGWINLHKQPWASYTGLGTYELEGVGVGLAWQPTRDFAASLLLASKVGTNPGANSITGADSDAKNGRMRVWVSANYQF
jgi:hemolysin activation/secretion protein